MFQTSLDGHYVHAKIISTLIQPILPQESLIEELKTFHFMDYQLPDHIGGFDFAYRLAE